MIAVNFNILNQKGAPAVFEDEVANRPPAGLVGRLFIATDTKTLQRDNGIGYDTIGDNILIGARNGLTLSGNDVKLGGSLIENTTISGDYGIGIGAAGNNVHKLYCYEGRTGVGQVYDGTAAILAQRNFATSTAEFDNKNLYGLASSFIANLSSGKINSGSSYNNAALYGALYISANNGQSTGFLRSIQGAAVLTNVNLQNVRLIEAKQVSFSGSNTVTNLTGLYIDTMKAGAVTNAYGIYQAGANDVNYFAGAVDIGSALTGTSAMFSGQLAVGTTNTSYIAALIRGSITASGVACGIWSNPTLIASANGDALNSINTDDNLILAAYTGVSHTGVKVANPSIVSGTLNRSYGIVIASQTRGSVNNYGLYIDAPSGGSTNIGLYNGGTTELGGSLTGTSATFSATVKLAGYTVATLPSGIVGMTAYVTDALAPAFGATLVGGGAVITKAFYNGTNWVNE